ncbi:pilus assembly protein [Serratia nematodiphila]|nr:pilus assembly protein [Serratia nematodiphila]
MNKGLAALLLTGVALFSTRGLAVEADMHFRGTLRAPPPCTVNSGAVVAVDFGQRVGITKVDGVNYRQTVDANIRCESPGVLKWEAILTLKGTATAFDKAAVQTDHTDLGIRIYQNGVPFTLNSSMQIDPNRPPQLEAVPVKKPGVELLEGAFAATATLQVDYQ